MVSLGTPLGQVVRAQKDLQQSLAISFVEGVEEFGVGLQDRCVASSRLLVVLKTFGQEKPPSTSTASCGCVLE